MVVERLNTSQVNSVPNIVQFKTKIDELLETLSSGTDAVELRDARKLLEGICPHLDATWVEENNVPTFLK